MSNFVNYQVELTEARRIFAYLREALEKIDGLNRIGFWSRWEEFEAQFLAWFVGRQLIPNIIGNQSTQNELFNSEEVNSGPYQERQKIEYEMKMWSKCHGELN